MLSNNRLEIKTIVNRKKQPRDGDTWILGKNGNLLIYTKNCNFEYEIEKIINTFHKYNEPAKLKIDLTYEPDDAANLHKTTKWVRDFVSTKNKDVVFVLNPEVAFSEHIFSDDIYIYNNNVGKGLIGSKLFIKNSTSNINYKPTNVIAEGGNIFNCVNAKTEHCIIVGELGLIPLNKMKYNMNKNSKEDALFLFVKENPIDTPYKNSLVGSQSASRYNRFFREREEIIRVRKFNKQNLRAQLPPLTKLIIIPHGFALHIDLEMTVLPNGVALVHSFDESTKLLKAHIKEISVKYKYFKLYEATKRQQKNSQHLFIKAKRKLEKAGFIVKEVCGFLSFGEIEEIIAMGFNGLPVVLPDGKILYTLPPNEPWYTKYFTQILKESGVSEIFPLTSQPLSALNNQLGFFRCQTNTISKKAVIDPTAKKDQPIKKFGMN